MDLAILVVWLMFTTASVAGNLLCWLPQGISLLQPCCTFTYAFFLSFLGTLVIEYDLPASRGLYNHRIGCSGPKGSSNFVKSEDNPYPT
jgi:hypothetical protein